MRTGLLWLAVVVSAWLRNRHYQAAAGKVSLEMNNEDERAYRYAEKMLAQAREELNRVDTKASILLSGIGVALSTAASVIVARGWSPFRLPLGPEVLWCAAAAAVTAGGAVLLAAVYPRRRQAAGLSGNWRRYYSYYADIRNSRSAADVTETIRQSASRQFELVTEQLLQVSVIADRKYRLVRRAMWLLAAGVACGAAMILLNAA